MKICVELETGEEGVIWNVKELETKNGRWEKAQKIKN